MLMSAMSTLNISISRNIRRKVMLMLRLSSLAHKLLMFMFMPMLASQVRTGKYQNDKCMFLLLFKSSMIKNSSTDFLASPVKGLELNRRSPIQALLVRDVSNQVSIS